jgi:hypothetical protein
VIGNLTPAQAIAQQAAELLWACATSEDHAVAWCRSPVYQAAEQAFLSAAKQAYGLTGPEADALRDLLSEYGPHDSLQGTTGHGVFSYAQEAGRQVREHRAEQAERETWAEHAPQGSMSDQRDYAALYHGQADVQAVVTLADNQVGPFLRKLGWGWSIRPTSWVITPDAEDAQQLAAERAAEPARAPVRCHSSDGMAGLGEVSDVTEPVAVVLREDGSVDVYGYVAVVDQRGMVPA